MIVVLIVFAALLGIVYYFAIGNNTNNESNVPIRATPIPGSTNLTCRGDSITLENGVYVYTENGIKKVDLQYIANLKGKPIVMLFYNNGCPHCREFEPTWCKLVQDNDISSRYYMVKVVCDWFTTACTSKDALALFSNMHIDSSPTIILARSDGKKITGYKALLPGDPVDFDYGSLHEYLVNGLTRQ